MSQQSKSSTPVGQHHPTLPEWMRNPSPVRPTRADRISAALTRRPALARLQRGWWGWRERRRLHERFPVGFKIVAFFVAWAVATALVLAAYAAFILA